MNECMTKDAGNVIERETTKTVDCMPILLINYAKTEQKETRSDD